MISHDGAGGRGSGRHAPTHEPPRRENSNGDASVDASDFIESLRAAYLHAASELHEAGEDVARLVRIKAGRARVRTRNLFLRLVVLAIAGVVLVGVLVASLVFIFLGLAGAVSYLFGAGAWVGFLAVGLLILLLVLGGASVFLHRFRKQRLAELRRSLEPRKDPASHRDAEPTRT